MPSQPTCAPPVIVTLPARLDAAAAELAADQITTAFTHGVRVVIADLTAAACCDRLLAATLSAHGSAAFDVDVLAGLGGDATLRRQGVRSRRCRGC
jgi:hypothetical protein